MSGRLRWFGFPAAVGDEPSGPVYGDLLWRPEPGERYRLALLTAGSSAAPFGTVVLSVGGWSTGQLPICPVLSPVEAFLPRSWRLEELKAVASAPVWVAVRRELRAR